MTDDHVCKPDATVYYCPTADDTESDCHGGFDVCCDHTDLHQQILACALAHCRRPHEAHSWEPQPGMKPVYCQGYGASGASPGSAVGQLPADILTLLAHRTYLSTACETARLLDGAIIRNPDRGDLPTWRDRMHNRCRLQHKFTGKACSCHCHEPAD
ncbi:hypothetical protein K388_05533 [Streptomyces sp. KhCrAH-43]|uniref:hypothetical protein n=1 Tax=unclassified Streptomyces TaxID=2593676 RepID=UPI0003610223|nr:MULTISPECIES: hypothetical protein [unclassified Streptomyces]MYX67403.1 hypothetical protein [Streptomyces sp. SID8373]RAJ53746.1 hypothetical protein K388_05533 [Streptomyces sp. KhCrAH-43]